jgi:PTS system galactitol-specific IIA component
MLGSGAFGSIVSLARLEAPTAEAAIRALARELEHAGCVRPSFAAAAVAREKRSPTGLPFPGVAVALPHAEPEHVLTPAVAVASLARGVRFRQMGSPEIALDVSLVVMPALTAKEQAASGLASLLERMQDAELRAALVAAESAPAIEAVLAAALGVGGA